MLALIVEDERLSADRLEKMIGKLTVEVEVLGVVDSLQSAQSWFRDNSPPDVVFLDVQLGDGTAFELLDHIPDGTPIIFTTAHDEYAIKAFRFNSVDYLLKPIAQSRLEEAMTKLVKLDGQEVFHQQWDTPRKENVKRILERDFKKRFLVKLGDQYIPVQVEDVAYFYYKNATTWLTTWDNRQYIVDYSLDQLEEMVDPMAFFRANRQTLTSLPSIAEIHTYFNSRLLLKLKPEQEAEVTISRDRVSDFKRWMDL